MAGQDPTAEALDRLDLERTELMRQLIAEIAIASGLDPGGLTAAEMTACSEEAEFAYDDWCAGAIASGRPRQSDGSPTQTLLAKLYELDDVVYALMEGARKPAEPL